MTSFQDLVDLAFGGPEDGQINFNALHSLLYALVFKLAAVNYLKRID